MKVEKKWKLPEEADFNSRLHSLMDSFSTLIQTYNCKVFGVWLHTNSNVIKIWLKNTKTVLMWIFHRNIKDSIINSEHCNMNISIYSINI